MPWTIASYNVNPDLNLFINGIDVSEGCSPAGYNNALRQMGADLATFWASYAPVSYPITIAQGGTGQITAPLALAALGGLSIAYRELPQVPKSATTSLDLTMSAGHLYYTGGVGSCGIPTNATIAFPIGTAITIVNNGSGALSIVRVAGVVMKWASTNTDGDRTLAIGGMAGLLKVGTDLWFISGAGLT